MLPSEKATNTRGRKMLHARMLGHPLSTSRRNKLKSSTFGLPKSRKYPMPDRSHAANAKARASEMFNKGKLSASQKAEIDRKANRKLKGK